jgi:hypothetical protein
VERIVDETVEKKEAAEKEKKDFKEFREEIALPQLFKH